MPDLFGFLLVSALTLKLLLQFLNNYANSYLYNKINLTYVIKSFNSIINTKYLSFISNSTGYWMTRIQNDPAKIAMIYVTLVEIIRLSVTFLVGLVLVYIFSIKLLIATILLIPFYYYSLVFMAPKLRKQNIIIKEKSAYIGGYIEEGLNGYEVLKTHCQDEFRESELNNKLNNLLKENIKLVKISGLSNLFSTGLASLIPIAVLWYGGYLVMEGSLTLGVLIGLNKFLGFILNPIASSMGLNAKLQDAISSKKRFLEVKELPKEPILNQKNEINFLDNIFVENVNFKYNDEIILNNFNLLLPARKFIVIKGDSGCGKSTLMKLLVRLLEEDSGTIRIGKTNINDIPIDSLRNNICLVPQNSYIFSDSIKYNISFKNEILPDELHALNIAGINDLLLDEKVKPGPRGLSISGGQKQRLALARAMIRNPKVLLLDEVTSEIDIKSELKILNNIKEYRKGLTTVIIAHRETALKIADIIIDFNGIKSNFSQVV